jgi:hypothetical protein
MATAGNSGTHRVTESCKHNRKIIVGYAGSIKHSGNIGTAESFRISEMQGLKELQELCFILAHAGTVRTALTVEL